MGLCGKSSGELERLLGYKPGSLAPGYMVGLLDAPVRPGEFEFRGDTRFPDGIPAGRSANVHDAMRQRLSHHPVDRQTFARLTADTTPFRGIGAEQIAKVFPVGASVGYEAGLGLVQYRLTVPKPFRIVLFVARGETFIRLANGSFKTERV